MLISPAHPLHRPFHPPIPTARVNQTFIERYFVRFEYKKIELLDESNSSIPGIKVADSTETDQLSVAKLLQNVEKSYDKGKFLLDESEN
jgi:hypothetical protein